MLEPFSSSHAQGYALSPLPNGTSVSGTVGQLEKLEEKARRQQLGAYGSKDSIRLSRETTEVPDEPIAAALSDPVPDSENLMAQVEIRDDLDRLNSVFAKSIARTSSKANPAAKSSPNPAKPLESSSDLIFLNTASNEDLERIPGIGPKLAAAIIDHRPFKRIEDLQSVPGIGQQKYEAAVTHLKR